MICTLVGLHRDELDDLIRHSERVLDTIFPKDGPRPKYHLGLDKTWHGLHYLLTGDPWEGGLPLSLAILGGEPIGEDTGYGPPRYLIPEEVAEVAAALEETTPDQLAARFDAKAMDEFGIYPHGWARDDGGLEWLLERFDDLAGFYGEAAAKDLAVLLCLS